MAGGFWRAEIEVTYRGLQGLFTQLTPEAQKRILRDISTGRLKGTLRKSDLSNPKDFSIHKEES